MRKRLIFTFVIRFLFVLLIPSAYSQSQLNYTINSTDEEILIDGFLTEKIWEKAHTISNFIQHIPLDTGLAYTKTEVKLTYNDKYLFIAAICYDALPGEHIFQSLRRDFDLMGGDAFQVMIDPFGDYTNGFFFGLNPEGVQQEGLIQVGGNRGVTMEWDILWYSEVKKSDGKWVVEMAIPFSSLRYAKNLKEWHFNFVRHDLKRNEVSTWGAVPRNFTVSSLVFSGNMVWDKPFNLGTANRAIIPYLSGGFQKENRPVDNPPSFVGNAGVDARVGIGSSLQLDLTVNPDFSQVEVDRQVTNLSRFTLFFPERRNFFIENSDLFADFGFRQIRPFFSRRIGLEDGEIIPIIGGARLSGKLGSDWRVGAMNIQTAQTENHASNNYSVAAVQRRVFKNSYIGLLGLNRTQTSGNIHDFNRIVGSDFALNTPNRRWTGKFLYHHAFTPTDNRDNFTHASFLAYSTPRWFAMWNHEYVGENFIASVGFVPRMERINPQTREITRAAFWRLEPMLSHIYYPKKKRKYIFQRLNIYLDRFTDNNYDLTDNELSLTYILLLQNTSRLTVKATDWTTKLFFDTDVTFTGDRTLSAAIGMYSYQDFSILYESDNRKPFYYSGFLLHGSYYQLLRHNTVANINYRFQPYGIFGFSFNHNAFMDPDYQIQKQLILLTFDAQLAFSKSIFFTTFFQYNTQINNVNINTRLQWRYRPMSDLFLVFSENYTSDFFLTKNRGLVLKFTRWLQ